MANKKFTTDIVIKTDDTYTCSVSKDYTDVYSLTQEIDSSLASDDGFVTILSGGAAKAATTIQDAKGVLIANKSNLACEILESLYDWKNSSNTDITNAVDVGGGSTRIRTVTRLLPAGDFVWIPNHRVISYSGGGSAGAIESACAASNGTVAELPSGVSSAVAETTLVDGSDLNTVINPETFTVDTGGTDNASMFKVGDLIKVGSEVMKVSSITGNTLTVDRGLLGSTIATHADNEAISFFFGNEYLSFDNSKCMSNKQGRFKQRGAFFGKARTSDAYVDGLVPGSVAIGPFYTEGGYLDWGLSGITANTETGLAASTAYTFHIVVDEFHTDGFDEVSSETAIAFTTDSSDTTFAGSSNAVLPKIQAVLDTQYYTTSSGLNGKKVKIFIHNGDVRVQSMSNHSETVVGIGNVSGTTPFGVGAFPALASSVPDLLGSEHGGGTTDDIVYGPKSTLAQENITDTVTGISKLNEKAFILDDGQGNLRYLDQIVGKIDYEKGHCEWQIASLPEAEFKVYGQSNSAHSGGVSYSALASNVIATIRARSINPIKNATLEVKVLQ